MAITLDWVRLNRLEEEDFWTDNLPTSSSGPYLPASSGPAMFQPTPTRLSFFFWFYTFANRRRRTKETPLTRQLHRYMDDRVGFLGQNDEWPSADREFRPILHVGSVRRRPVAHSNNPPLSLSNLIYLCTNDLIICSIT